MKRNLIDPFIIALVAAVALACFFPYPGTKESPFHLHTIADIGVSVIFLFYGLQLGPEKLKAGLHNTRLHLVIQASTFILFPAIIILLKPLFATAFLAQAWLPFFFLAALPSTVSSSVVMVSIAGGNIPAAIFNASISSLLGIFITPVWMGLFIHSNAGDPGISYVIGKLLLQVLLPVAIGLVLHKRCWPFAARNKKQIKLFDQAIILLIVYCAFSESFYTGAFKNYSISSLLLLLFMVTALFFLVYGIMTLVAVRLHFNRQDRITATFCGSKKSLVHGSVMAKVLFANAANTGLILLPVMLFHAIQLMIVSIIAGKLHTKSYEQDYNISE
ncbi:bile acid:sodium symporter family protein [Flavihumibacter fluvii]|uniref:bile acid:sodium symporter family protein n=1 Tax=Flavihumibacter fluvii TaxID=2838157 RepID=UPI001BDF17FC|nr:bile acid:sodium symporter family protein [Flavihumibacter fluvii]ULQ53307.1 bile acid:sodium symporter [Flavihumibacter fluvii]